MYFPIYTFDPICLAAIMFEKLQNFTTTPKTAHADCDARLEAAEIAFRVALSSSVPRNGS